MAYTLGNKYAKNCCKQHFSNLTYRGRYSHMFFGTQCISVLSLESVFNRCFRVHPAQQRN